MASRMLEGPNVRKLIIEKISRDVIPPGGGLVEGINFLSDPKKISSCWQAAAEWVKSAITVVRQAAEPNHWKDATDEEIAAEILKQIAAKRQLSRGHS